MPLDKICYICGRGFGTASIGIHLPKCQEKWVLRNAALAPSERRPLPQMPPGYEYAVLGQPRPRTQATSSSLDATPVGGNRNANQNQNIIRGGGGNAGDGMGRRMSLGSSAAPSYFVGSACRSCGRNFAPDRIDKHERVCKGQVKILKKGEGAISQQYIKPMHQGSRGPGGSGGGSRGGGNDFGDFSLDHFDPRDYFSAAMTGPKQRDNSRISDSRGLKSRGGNTRLGASGGGGGSTSRSRWREKHAEFINAIRHAKQVTQYIHSGGDIRGLPPPPPSSNPDYVQCPHCLRKYSQEAGARHIPKCADIINKPKPPPHLRGGLTISPSRFKSSTQQYTPYHNQYASSSYINNNNNNQPSYYNESTDFSSYPSSSSSSSHTPRRSRPHIARVSTASTKTPNKLPFEVPSLDLDRLRRPMTSGLPQSGNHDRGQRDGANDYDMPQYNTTTGLSSHRNSSRNGADGKGDRMKRVQTQRGYRTTRENEGSRLSSRNQQQQQEEDTMVGRDGVGRGRGEGRERAGWRRVDDVTEDPLALYERTLESARSMSTRGMRSQGYSNMNGVDGYESARSSRLKYGGGGGGGGYDDADDGDSMDSYRYRQTSRMKGERNGVEGGVNSLYDIPRLIVVHKGGDGGGDDDVDSVHGLESSRIYGDRSARDNSYNNHPNHRNPITTSSSTSVTKDGRGKSGMDDERNDESSMANDPHHLERSRYLAMRRTSLTPAKQRPGGGGRNGGGGSLVRSSTQRVPSTLNNHGQGMSSSSSSSSSSNGSGGMYSRSNGGGTLDDGEPFVQYDSPSPNLGPTKVPSLPMSSSSSSSSYPHDFGYGGNRDGGDKVLARGGGNGNGNGGGSGGGSGKTNSLKDRPPFSVHGPMSEHSRKVASTLAKKQASEAPTRPSSPVSSSYDIGRSSGNRNPGHGSTSHNNSTTGNLKRQPTQHRPPSEAMKYSMSGQGSVTARPGTVERRREARLSIDERPEWKGVLDHPPTKPRSRVRDDEGSVVGGGGGGGGGSGGGNRSVSRGKTSRLPNRLIAGRPPWDSGTDNDSGFTGSVGGGGSGSIGSSSSSLGVNGSYSAIARNPVKRALLLGGKGDNDSMQGSYGRIHMETGNGNSSSSSSSSSSSNGYGGHDREYDPWAPVPRSMSRRARLYSDHYNQGTLDLSPPRAPQPLRHNYSNQSSSSSSSSSSMLSKEGRAQMFVADAQPYYPSASAPSSSTSSSSSSSSSSLARDSMMHSSVNNHLYRSHISTQAPFASFDIPLSARPTSSQYGDFYRY